MRRTFLAAGLVAATLGLGFASFAYAGDDDRPGAGWLSIGQVAQRLQGMGYRRIAEIEADDGLWEAKAEKNGVFYKIKMDPLNGRVLERRAKGDHDHDDD